jgi:hypothetical protein
MKNMHHFNVYLTDKGWSWVDEFWSGSDHGLSLGAVQLIPAGEMYDKPVRLKRMS